MEDVNKKCGNIAYAAIPIPQRARADERAPLAGRFEICVSTS